MKIVFLAADTIRSRAYAQAIIRAEIKLDHVILYKDSIVRSGQSDYVLGFNESDENGLYLFDPSVSLETSLSKLDDKFFTVDCGDVNSKEIISILTTLQADLVIFSGYGGEIVSALLLGLGPKFLHVHSGSLPKFPGSTTIFYEMMIEKKCAASSIFLSNDIDAGEVLVVKNYPLPANNIDIDYIYDPAIRADLLCETLKALKGGDIQLSKQVSDHKIGPNYFVIHPVLKHLSIMSTCIEFET